jgi:hypothetical protein
MPHQPSHPRPPHQQQQHCPMWNSVKSRAHLEPSQFQWTQCSDGQRCFGASENVLVNGKQWNLHATSHGHSAFNAADDIQSSNLHLAPSLLPNSCHYTSADHRTNASLSAVHGPIRFK